VKARIYNTQKYEGVGNYVNANMYICMSTAHLKQLWLNILCYTNSLWTSSIKANSQTVFF